MAYPGFGVGGILDSLHVCKKIFDHAHLKLTASINFHITMTMCLFLGVEN